MARRQATSQVVVEGYSQVQKALKDYAPEARKAYMKEIRSEAKPVLDAARRNFSWSKRIPKALALSVTQRGVGIRIKRAKAPHGSIYERGSKGNPGQVRHPIPNSDEWASSPTRPGIKPALDQNRAHILAATERALQRAASKVGL